MNTLIVQSSGGYQLLDSGDGEKLERYGDIVVARPDPQALWKKRLSPKEWAKADAVFERSGERSGWRFSKNVPERWQITCGGLSFWIHPSSFKHTGLFPEQRPNWDWIQKVVKAAPAKKEPPQVLNLFGYTGGATLAAAKAGAAVCHVDGSKVAVRWARDNADISNLSQKPVRWIVDDARTFVKREIKRGRRYEGIIMDPPAFGHGPNKELWKIEKDFLPFLDDCTKLLSDRPLFFLINGYAAGYSAIAYGNCLQGALKKEVEVGELALQEEGVGGRLLPAGIVARYAWPAL